MTQLGEVRNARDVGHPNSHAKFMYCSWNVLLRSGGGARV